MINYTQTLNLMGTSCPMNFVLIKSALDRMPPGGVIQARLDKASVGTDVAASLRESGYEVVSLKEKEGACVLVVRKRPPGARKPVSLRARRNKDCGCGSARRRRR